MKIRGIDQDIQMIDPQKCLKNSFGLRIEFKNYFLRSSSNVTIAIDELKVMSGIIVVAYELCGKDKKYDRDYAIEKLHDYSLSIRAKLIQVIFGIIQADSSWSTLPNRPFAEG
ncbi:hypothetical protein CTI12_AA180500 [Artemisia annua]|uniref:Uncharacterized protein n=1 Tax=Artemisia annua TaxID=35608 RepID=A0A2U1P8I5_ARTAN|nr:hypothetical protein CTI12_AA180500 [Artemisia annua]